MERFRDSHGTEARVGGTVKYRHPLGGSMKDGLSSFDILAVTAELQALVGAFVDKVYQREDELIFKVNRPGAGRRELYARSGKWLFLREVPDKPESPPPFAATLRKHLDNARIERVQQHGFDRIVVLSFDRGTDLIFELFGKGNVVLVEGGTTLAAMRRVAFRDRTVAVGVPYGFPPAAADPLAMSADAFVASIVAANGAIVKVLASGMNLGGQYAEVVCALAGVEKTAHLADPSDERTRHLHATIVRFAREVRDSPNPEVVLHEGVPIDATPVPLARYAAYERRSFRTFSEALAFYVDHAPAPAPAREDPTAKLRRRIEQQEGTLRQLRETIVQAGALAEFLYAHYAQFEELLGKAREGTVEPGGAVLAVDPERHRLRVAVADVAEIELDWTEDVNGNVQLQYGRRREAQEKLAKVEKALEASRRELGKAVKEAAKVAAKPRVKPTKAFWFEAYRWFLSSDGFLVIGGRDAKLNDAIVKKHLKDGDRYVHADLHGAPSCVVKGGSSAGDATLREACAFALGWSKAWSAGLASGSAFWVLPEQVSKQAESGQYVARGAWVIRGKRNYVHDIPVRAAVGEIEHEGHRKVMAGPVDALAARSTRYVVIGPGEGAREPFVRRLAAAFQVPVEEVSRVLPPGNVQVVEQVGIDA